MCYVKNDVKVSEYTYIIWKLDIYNYVKVSDCNWQQKKAPNLDQLFLLCKNLHLWLRQSNKNVGVIHCTDGKAISATVAGAFMCYCKLFDNASAAMHLFTARRMVPSITPSQKRYACKNL